jgi:hypothetical protein
MFDTYVTITGIGINSNVTENIINQLHDWSHTTKLQLDSPFTRVSIRKHYARIGLTGSLVDGGIIKVVEYGLDDGIGLFIVNIGLDGFVGRDQVGEVGSCIRIA